MCLGIVRYSKVTIVMDWRIVRIVIEAEIDINPFRTPSDFYTLISVQKLKSGSPRVKTRHLNGLCRKY